MRSLSLQGTRARELKHSCTIQRLGQGDGRSLLGDVHPQRFSLTRNRQYLLSAFLRRRSPFPAQRQRANLKRSTPQGGKRKGSKPYEGANLVLSNSGEI